MALRKLATLPQDDRDTIAFAQSFLARKHMRECIAILHDSVQPGGVYHDVKEVQHMYAQASLNVLPAGWSKLSVPERGAYRFQRGQNVAAHLETIPGALKCIRLSVCYAKALSDMREPEKARDCLEKLYSNPRRRRNFYLNTRGTCMLAYLYRRCGQPDKAIRLMEEAIVDNARNRKNEYLNYTYATTLKLTGHEDEAVAFLRRMMGTRDGVLRFHPESHQLLESMTNSSSRGQAAQRFRHAK